MPKSASPVRLQQELMQQATLAGARHYRSAAEQIEDWSTLGQQVARVLDPDKLLDVFTGLSALKVVPIATSAVDPEQAFAALEEQRRSGQLSQSVSGTSLRYQASRARPGVLEEINPNGMRRLGLRIPKAYATELGVRPGSEMEVNLEAGTLLSRPAAAVVEAW